MSVTMDWKAALAQIVAEHQERPEERPSREEMLAFRAGELSKEERNRLVEYACWNPQVARELFDLLRSPLPEDDKPPGRDPDQDRRWRAMRERLMSEGILRVNAASEATARRDWDRVRRSLHLAASFTAGAALALGLSGLLSRARPGPAPALLPANLPIVELVALSDAGGGQRRGLGATIVPAGADGIVLTMAVPGLPSEPAPARYDLEILHGRERILRRPGLEPGEGGVIVLLLPRDRLRDGEYRLLLRNCNGRTVATFRLELEVAG